MFERFTERARQVVVLAQGEARNRADNYIGPEHILLGLLREEEGLAAKILSSLEVTVDGVRVAAEKRRLTMSECVPLHKEGQLPFTPRARKIFELSLREALSLGHNYIGTEHILLGIIRENDNVAMTILLESYDLSSEKLRNEVIRMLSGPKAPILEQSKTMLVNQARLDEEARRVVDKGHRFQIVPGHIYGPAVVHNGWLVDNCPTEDSAERICAALNELAYDGALSWGLPAVNALEETEVGRVLRALAKLYRSGK